MTIHLTLSRAPSHMGYVAMPRNGARDKSTDGRTDGLTKNALSRHIKIFSYVTRGRAYRLSLWKTP